MLGSWEAGNAQTGGGGAREVTVTSADRGRLQAAVPARKKIRAGE